jgi:TIR domain
MVSHGDDEPPDPQQVTAGSDAYVAGRDIHVNRPAAVERHDDDLRGPNFNEAAGVQVGSGNVQVNNFFYGGIYTADSAGAGPVTSGPDAAKPSFPGHAFISYVREDSAEIDVLQRALEASGVRVWRDTDDLWPGEDWRAKVRDAITQDALVFIACFSSRSVARPTSYQYEELLLAVDQLRSRRPGHPWLIPVRLDDCDIPDVDLGGGRRLTSIQRADLFGAKRDLETSRLVAVVQRLLREPGPPPGRPGATRMTPGGPSASR